MEHIAALLRQGRVQVAGIQHSGKDRARQTAEIFATALNPTEGLTDCEGINPLDDVTAFAKRLDATANQMYVGHLPFMQRLVSYLMIGDPERVVIEFQNGGVVCLDHNFDNRCWIIKWNVVPNLGSI